jgi:hypothetical protein
MRAWTHIVREALQDRSKVRSLLEFVVADHEFAKAVEYTHDVSAVFVDDWYGFFINLHILSPLVRLFELLSIWNMLHVINIIAGLFVHDNK